MQWQNKVFKLAETKNMAETLPGHLVCVLLQLLCVLSYAVKRGGVENWKIITRTSKCGRYKQEDKALCMQTPGKMKLYATSNLIMLVSVEQKAHFTFCPSLPKSFSQAVSMVGYPRIIQKPMVRNGKILVLRWMICALK